MRACLPSSPDCTREGGSYYTAAVGSTADVSQEQGEAAGNFQRTGPSGGSWFSAGADPRQTAGQAIIGRSRNARRSEDLFDDGEDDVPVGFGSAEDRNHPDTIVREKPLASLYISGSESLQ